MQDSAPPKDQAELLNAEVSASKWHLTSWYLLASISPLKKMFLAALPVATAASPDLFPLVNPLNPAFGWVCLENILDNAF